ncbi:transcriptional activator DEMETER-like [Corylus avellana]|uniref:transcriptional activator DEMETER-like n=1 Tax=Corylus avellana TaxID=13451 RepID=UPI00286D3A19|nr:transcriptional activator DEMETER-like [Corylus avellana]
MSESQAGLRQIMSESQAGPKWVLVKSRTGPGRVSVKSRAGPNQVPAGSRSSPVRVPDESWSSPGQVTVKSRTDLGQVLGGVKSRAGSGQVLVKNLTFDINAEGSQPCSTSTLVPENGNKRSRQKKKKYCPKVVSEGKPKKTPKPKTPKPANLKRASASAKKKKNNSVKRTLIFDTQDDMEKPESGALDSSQCSNHREIVNTITEKQEHPNQSFQVDQCCTTGRRIGPNFPQLWKKRRVGRSCRKNMATIILSLCQPEAKRTKKSNMYTRHNTADLIIAPWPILETKKKNRSKGCTRRRSNLTALPVCNQLQSGRQEQKLEISHGPETRKDAFVNSEFYAGKSEGSLAKDSDFQLRGTFHLPETTYWIVLIPNHHLFDPGKQEESINVLVEKLGGDGQNHLLEQDQNSYGPNSGHGTVVSLEEQEQIANGPNNNGHGTVVSLEEQEQIANGPNNSGHGILVPYQEQDQNGQDPTSIGTLVPYYEEQDQNAHDLTSSHTLVPYEGPFNPIKKQRVLAKVNLDPETIMVWKQLMDYKSSEGETKANEEKEKWWAEERNVFSGRVNAFIAIMNDIQGDRHFTPWKGSVVDSVVGVFLTQNVADHLSSNAFLSLAAKFPSSNHRGSQESVGSNGTTYDSKGNEFIVSEPEPQPDMSYGLENGTEILTEMSEGPSLETSLLCSDIINDLKLNHQGAYAFELPLFPTNPEFNSQEESGIETNPHACHENESSVDEKAQSQKRKMQPANDANTMKKKGRKGRKTNLKEEKLSSDMAFDETKAAATRGKKKIKKVEEEIDWDELRRTYSSAKPRGSNQMDSVDWEAVRCAEHKDVADAIKERGQHNIIAGRIQDFLNKVVKLHKSIDLEWLRNVPADLAKKYLLEVNGLGLKSVECVRLLCLQNIAFPVDTNVGRISVRLGWVPLQPLPGNLQIHLLEQYPVMDTVQKYLWPRLCTLDQGTLYELHYQMITFGKVFCTKKNPNCNACPMKGDCRHYGSAFASATLALPAPEEKSIVVHSMTGETLNLVSNRTPLSILEANPFPGSGSQAKNFEPIVEEPPSPEPECTELPEIEDFFRDPDEIPTIKLGVDKFKAYLQNLDENHVVIHDNNMSRALVALTAEAASIPMPKLKSVSRLRTEHLVYALPDYHPLLTVTGLDKREDDDPCPYLLAIWNAGETANSFEPPTKQCNSEFGELCNEEKCFSCNSTREQNSNIIRGTILIPCRTATKGSFPLNGTYFQVNEVFADDESSQNPIHVPREWLWHLERRTAYFASSTSALFRGLSTDAIRTGFREGFICVRGFDRKTGCPKPLVQRLHLLGYKMGKD